MVQSGQFTRARCLFAAGVSQSFLRVWPATMKQLATPRVWFAALSACWCCAGLAAGQERADAPKSAPANKGQAAKDAEAIAFFEKDVLPILRANCFECHGGGEKVQAQFRLTSREGLLKGGELGPAISLENPAESQLLDAINYGTLQMPPKGKLPPREIELLTRWVKMGVPFTPDKDYGVAPASDPRAVPRVNDETRNFWSFRPVKRPSVPAVKNKAWVRSPIDAFILHGLEKNGLAPAAPADKVALLRRATYDLTGLPPTPAEVDAFVADKSAEAFAQVVDRLLAVAALRRAVGPPLARPGALRRDQQLRARRREAERLAVPRLRHPLVQRRQAVRPLRARAARRRRAASR